MAISEVALRLVMSGGRETATLLDGVSKQAAGLADTLGKAGKSAKGFSTAMGTAEKSTADASTVIGRSNAAIAKSLGTVADAQATVAAASEKAAQTRVKAAEAVMEAERLRAAGDVEGAKAAQDLAVQLGRTAAAEDKVAAAMRRTATASKANVTAMRARQTAFVGAGGSPALSGGAYAMGKAAALGGAITKTGLAAGAFLGYEGVKQYGTLSTSQTRLNTLANVPVSQIPGLTQWEINRSVALRQDANTLSQMAYFIASSSPGHPYSAKTLESLTAGAAKFATITGADPASAARVLGTIRANGGLGTRNPTQIVGLARATIGMGDMTPEEYLGALNTGGLLPMARQRHVSLLQLGGILANLGDIGVRGSVAGTRLTHGISMLTSPNSSTAQAAYASLGLSPTIIDQITRSQRAGGLPAGIALLKKQLGLAQPALAAQYATSPAQIRSYGFNQAQAQSIAKQGGASGVDMLISQAFGGSRYGSTILALLQGLTRSNTKTAAIAKAATPGSVATAFGAASNTPTEQWHRLQLDIRQLELTIGQKLLPDLIHMFDWFNRNEGVVKDVAMALGTIAIPAVAAYAATLVGKGLSAVTNFTNGIRGIGPASSTATTTMSTGMRVAQGSVLALTAAFGVWELGAATRSHGAGGAVTAGLGGAMAGAFVGFTTLGAEIGGPWGAAVGAAVGGLIGLASHFDNVNQNVINTTTNLQKLGHTLGSTLGTDPSQFRTNTKSWISQYLTGHPGLSQYLQGKNVNISDLMKLMTEAGRFSQLPPNQQTTLGMSYFKDPWLQNIGSNPADLQYMWLMIEAFGKYYPGAAATAGILHPNAPIPGMGTGGGGKGGGGSYTGRHPQHHAMGGYAAPFMPTWVGENGPEIISPTVPSYVTPNNVAMGDGVFELHVHSHLDGREVAETVSRHRLDAKARL